MKNPLIKRIPRELKSDLAKYIVMFLFMTMLVSLVSGFLVADNSIQHAYHEGFEKYNIEDGHFATNLPLDEDLIEQLEEAGNITIYDLYYFEETQQENGAKIRVYKDRTDVNLECLFDGEMPDSDSEIAIDRVYAKNNGISIGDAITLNERELTVSGLVSVPDYSAMFEKTSDMMFDSVNFSIAIMTDEGYERVASVHQNYNYAWKYNTDKDIENEKIASELSEDLVDALKDVLEKYDMQIIQSQMDASKIITPEDYLPRYQNQAINFAGEDLGGDKAMFVLFDYILTAILAFVFAVTTSNTINQEATVIGTLRASGYSRGELARHYMILPVLVTLVAALCGNVLGYTVFKGHMADLYYNSYSLVSYDTLWNAEAFLETTAVPIVLMFVINLIVITTKLRLSPLRFIRRDLSKRGRKKAFRLNTKIPIMTRFRIRILFQNIPNYITLFFGIALGGILIIFGTMFGPLLEAFGERIEESQLAKYQYILIEQVETENVNAEKYCVSSLKTTDEKYMTDEVSIYGVIEDSKYVDADIPLGRVLISNGMATKFKLIDGDVVKLNDPYTDKDYEFIVGGIYDYDAAMAIFMNDGDYKEVFEEDEDYFSGYFSNEELKDIDKEDIATIITVEDLQKLSRQLKVSMGNFMNLFKVFGAIIFILLMFLMSKQVIEKNAQSISMTKILGYSGKEIGSLYIISTSLVVLLSLLITIPITDAVLRWAFDSYIYTKMSGYIPYLVSKNCYVTMLVIGVLSYAFVSIFLMIKINRIPKSDALKNVE